jgi:hypothetical protein
MYSPTLLLPHSRLLWRCISAINLSIHKDPCRPMRT